MVPSRGAVLGSTSHPREARGSSPGPDWHLPPLPSDSPLEGRHQRLHTHPHPLRQPLPSSSTFPVITNPWGRGRRRPSRVPGKPRQQTPNTRFGPRPPPPRPGSPTSAGPGVAGERGGPDGGKPLAALSLARVQQDVNSGQAAATPPPPGPKARGQADTCRGHSVPAPRTHAGRRFEVKQGVKVASSRALTPLAPESQDRVPRWVGGGPRAALGLDVRVH